MVTNLLPKEGAPAWAYAAHDLTTKWLCSLKILHSNLQFGVSLAIHLPSHSAHDKPLILRYEGNNLVPGKSSFTINNTTLPAELARNGESKPGTLSLTLKEPCSLWYSKTSSSSLRADFPKLVNFARATEVRICFDSNWLGKHRKKFGDILKGSQEFAEILHLPEFISCYEQAQWPLLEFILNAGPVAHVPTKDLASGVVPSIENAEIKVPPFEGVEHESPPPYAHVSGKRSRCAGSSPTPDYDSKRVRNRSTPSTETECAAPPPSFRADSIASSGATVEVDFFQERVTSTLKDVLPHLLESARAELVKKELPKVVRKELSQAVRAELPRVLEELVQKTLADHSPRQRLSPTPPVTQIPDATIHNGPILNHHIVLRTIIEGAVTKVLREFLEDAADQAEQLYDAAVLEVEERGDEVGRSIEVDIDHRLAAFNDELNEMEDESKQNIAECSEEIAAHAEEVVLDTCRRLDQLGDITINQTLCKLRDPLVSYQSRRARSLPVSKEEKKTIADAT